jgi:hypothetical protein
MVEGMLRRVGRRDMFALATLGLAGSGIPLWLSAAAGAIGIPSNDDWVYMRAAGSLFRTGSVDMPGHTAASIGQLVMDQVEAMVDRLATATLAGPDTPGAAARRVPRATAE